MTSVFGTLELRPTRIGFLVDPEDMTAVRLAMQICNCLWGGIYNPIIPTCKTIPNSWKSPHGMDKTPTALAKGYIRFFEPDVFVESSEGLATEFGINSFRLDSGVNSVIPIRSFLERDQYSRSNVPLGLSAFDVYKHLYDHEFKFVTRHGHRIGIFKASSLEDAPFLDATSGGFPQTGTLKPLARHYRDAFAPDEINATGKTWLKAMRDGMRFPLHFTTHSLDRDYAGSNEPTFFVIDPKSSLDLIDFWNIRLFHRNVIPININWFKELSSFIRGSIRSNYRPIPDNRNGVMVITTLQFGRSIAEIHVQDLISQAKLTNLPQGAWSYKTWYDPIWSDRREDFAWGPQRVRLKASSQRIDAPVVEENKRFSLRYGTLAPEFAPEFRNNSFGWANVLRLSDLGSNSTLALSFPSDFDSEHTHYLRAGGAIIPSRDGFVLPQRYKGHNEYLQLLTGRAALSSWLKQHNIETSISSSGRATDQVMQSLGSSWGIKLLAHEDTLRLLDKMAKSSRTYRDGTVEEFQDRTASTADWTRLISRRQQDAWSHRISLDQFVRANILKLGISIDCDHCGSANWYAINDLKETILCERCRREYSFPQGTIDFTNTPWKFRVVGPFSIPNYAEGAYATVLSLRVFSSALSGGNASLTYAPGLILKSESFGEIEVDFSLWYQRENLGGGQQETLTIFGEAKSFGTKSFHTADVDRMQKIANLFPGSFLVFATLKASLHEDEISAIAKLASWGREPLDDGRPRAPVIVLTGTELFCSWQIQETWKHLDGKRKEFAEHGYLSLDNLWTLADLTQQIYLNLPSRSEELQRRWETQKELSMKHPKSKKAVKAPNKNRK